MPDDAGSAAAAEAAALRILRGASQSAAALQRRLVRRGFTVEAASAATARMIEHGYVDDAALATALAVRSRRTGHGRVQLAAQLRARGIDDVAVAGVLAGSDPDAEREAALELARRLFGRAADHDVEVRRRVFATLQRRGFDTETAHWALRRLERPD